MTADIEQQLAEIEALLAQYPAGLSRGEIANNLTFSLVNKTLQRRLATLCATGRAGISGDKRGARYFPARAQIETKFSENRDTSVRVFTDKSLEALKLLDIPVRSREKVSYKRELLDSYVPNETMYVPNEARKLLRDEGRRFDERLAAGTYAREICQRLLIDLSYNSSRLEGNTYSVLDTQKLIEEGVAAEGKIREETVMIMNHKEAILFLVENARDIDLNPFTIFNLHNLLSQDLLVNPGSCGNVRTIEVDIGGSTYKPLNNPHVLRELLELILLKARKIDDPFEQSFFVLVHLSYLQVFEDVNKRTSRLACNIPFIKGNFCPLSFLDVSRDDYSAALITMYETNNFWPMLDLFVWAYRRSCNQYDVVKKSLGDIDAFRIQYRQQRKEVMGQVIRQELHGKRAEACIDGYCQKKDILEIDKFMAMTLADLDALHAGAIVGLGVSESQFNKWVSKKSFS